MANDYAKDVLVTADWVEERLDDFQDDGSDLRLVEVDVDTEAYEDAHAPGAIGFNWETQLQDQTQRDILDKEDFEDLLGSHGISEDDTVVLYGDNSNWFAAYTYWQFKYYGHDEVYLLDGGREYWLENDYPTGRGARLLGHRVRRRRPAREHPRVPRGRRERDRARRSPRRRSLARRVLRRNPRAPRTPGDRPARGHIPGAKNISWPP